jgi:hypothetical protein
MDDVLFGIELDRPIPLQHIGLPSWIVSSCLKLIKYCDSAVLIDNIIVDERQGTPSYRRPSILTPIVCAANNVNAWTIGDGNMVRYHNISDPQRQWEMDRMSQNHSRYFSSEFRPVLAEYNAWLWYGFQPPLTNIDSCYRRAFYRPSKDPVAGDTPYLPSKPVDEMPLNALSLGLPRSLRRQDHSFHADPHLAYAFEFSADYFDPATFILRPTFADKSLRQMQDRYGEGYSQSLAAALASSPIVRQLTKRWLMDVAQITMDAQGVARVYVVCRSRPFGVQGRTVYFWTVMFELTEERTVMGR